LAQNAESGHIRGTMRSASFTQAVFGTILLVGCGAAPTPAPKVAAQPAPKVARAPQPARPPKGALFREDVDAFVDGGFPQFLQRVEVEPRLVEGQFRGWSIVNLSPRDFWSGVDLKPGDIVTRVNDLPIERETEAFDVFESLKEAPTLRVSFQRDGQERMLEYRIVEHAN
jgi:type II secretory pathway component PulC